MFYLCTEIITFPLKGRLSFFIVSGKIPYRVKFYTKAMGLTGHTFGVRVQAPFGARVQKVQRVQRERFLRWMGLRPKGS